MKTTDEATKAFKATIKKHYRHLNVAEQGKGKTFKFIDIATESLWQAFELGWKASRTAALDEAIEIIRKHVGDISNSKLNTELLELRNGK